MNPIQIKSALISVFSKEGLEEIVKKLAALDVRILSTGGTRQTIESYGVQVHPVEDLTAYPSILDGRVKTLHPKVFGGILARREESHLAQLTEYAIPEIDLVIVDLYPFEETVKTSTDASEIIEKIDIGGISLIRAAAKNFRDVLVIPSKAQYPFLLDLLKKKHGYSDLTDRQFLANQAFKVSSHYDTAIFNYFNTDQSEMAFRASFNQSRTLRYGENPHQQGAYFGDLDAMFEQISGKAISYNNLVDIDGAMHLMREFKDRGPTFAILKHTNACGVATRDSVLEAWNAALAGDPVSAFGGILISNTPVDAATAEAINKIFYEVLLAPGFEPDALEMLKKRSKRILLQIRDYPAPKYQFKSLLNGVIRQESDLVTEGADDLQTVTTVAPDRNQVNDLIFANICVKHLKSNAIALAKNGQLVGMGCGQTSRVDALKQAIAKARAFNLDLEGAVMASDAFFPFPDCVEIADHAGIRAVVQPGGSIKDKDSIEYCNAHGMAMVFTGNRHFKH